MKRPAVRTSIAGVVLAAFVVLATGCTPSGYNLEQRATASLYRGRTGIAVAPTDVSCTVGDGYHGGADYTDHWDGTCTVRGATFRVSSMYALNVSGPGYPYKSDNLGTWYSGANIRVDDGRNPSTFGGNYSFKPSGTQWAFNAKGCWGGGC